MLTTDDDSGLTVAEMRVLLSRRRDAALATWWLELLDSNPSLIQITSVRRRPVSIQLAYRFHGPRFPIPVDATMDLPLGEVTAEDLALIVVRVNPGAAAEVVDECMSPDRVERAREWLTRFWLRLPPDGDEDGATGG